MTTVELTKKVQNLSREVQRLKSVVLEGIAYDASGKLAPEIANKLYTSDYREPVYRFTSEKDLLHHLKESK